MVKVWSCSFTLSNRFAGAVGVVPPHKLHVGNILPGPDRPVHLHGDFFEEHVAGLGQPVPRIRHRVYGQKNYWMVQSGLLLIHIPHSHLEPPVDDLTIGWGSPTCLPSPPATRLSRSRPCPFPTGDVSPAADDDLFARIGHVGRDVLVAESLDRKVNVSACS